MKIQLLAFGLLALTLSACTDLNAPYGSPYGYDSSPRYNDPYARRPSYDYDRDRYYDKKKEIHEDRRELERERERLEEERRRVQEERARQDAAKAAQRPREQCPSGFSPSENKCSSEERRRGCRDMRLPGGLGCVSR